MVHKKNVILETFRDKEASFLDALTLLLALEDRGYKMSKRGLSNFIRNSMENKYLVSSRDQKGIIVGWSLIRYV